MENVQSPISGMSINNVLDEEELTVRVFVDSEQVNLNTISESEFFDAACKFIHDTYDFDVTGAKIYETFTNRN